MAPKSGWVTVGKIGVTRLFWHLGKYGEYKDLKFELMKVISDTNVCNIIPNISKEM